MRRGFSVGAASILIIGVVIAARVGLIARSINELGAAGANVQGLVIETIEIALATLAICLACVLSLGLPIYLRELSLSKPKPASHVLRAVRSDRTESALEALSGLGSGGGRFLPWVYNVTVDERGIRLVRGISRARPVYEAAWSDVRSIDVAEMEDFGDVSSYIVLTIAAREGNEVEIPLAFIPRGLLRLRPLSPVQARGVSDLLQRLQNA